jgi:Flp pilus assembly pilin Flp
MTMQFSATVVRSAWAQAIGLAMAIAMPWRQRSDVHGKDRGATAVEYGLLVGLIAVVIIVAVSALGGRLQAIFANLAAQLGG